MNRHDEARGLTYFLLNPSRDYPNEVCLLSIAISDFSRRRKSVMQINASSLLQVPSYQPVATASNIRCPLILIAAELDNLCFFANALAVIDAAPHAEFVKLHGGESLSNDWVFFFSAVRYTHILFPSLLFIRWPF